MEVTTKVIIMAPKRTSLRPNARNRAAYVSAAWAQVLKSKSEPCALRRLKNGMLDTARRSGNFLTKIRLNSETQLLRLPPEVRNRIWECALGGKVLDVVWVETSRGRYIEERTSIAPDTFPIYSHALLQVCRQIYAETALIPFSSNAFRFASEEAFDWARHLLPIQQKLLTEVHVVTKEAERMSGGRYRFQFGSLMPDAFPIEVFPSVKRIVIEVGYSFRSFFGTDEVLTEEEQDILIESRIAKITEYFTQGKPNVELIFEHVNHHFETCSVSSE